MKIPDTQNHIASFIEKLENEKLPRMVVDSFLYYYHKVINGETGIIYDKDIECMRENEIVYSNDLSGYSVSGKKAINNTVRIVLNGGLGTSMGLSKAKSLIKVREGKTFLDIIVQQAEKSNIKLAFMNSFGTDKDTSDALQKMDLPVLPIMFLQHKYPKILRNSFGPAVWPENAKMEWNPPGHGDIYAALYTSGVLEQLIMQGVKYAFISNSDNLGATVDEAILGYFAQNNFPFLMEVSDRTQSDLKGGHIARHKNGHLILREAAQCIDSELDAFRDISCYSFFNTNNIWINIVYLKELIREKGFVYLPLILNPKTLDPRNETSPEVYQIETAMGSAISLFDGANAVRVPRTRFFPVKKCSDLLAVRSDCYMIRDEKLVYNPERKLPEIRINLDSRYYGKIDQFDDRFKEGVPSLVECESLSILGDVFFEKDVKITGNISINNTSNTPVLVERNSVIDNNITF
ncbi:MAG: UTP--glucose-1-phosphate uridylyltransferase [Proteobacteria bacterium]|nr:UTP--glucose-1-phosphate uridylyltransferase [Pseudomonadota bacterium]